MSDVPTRGVFAVYSIDGPHMLTLCTQTWQLLPVVVSNISCPKMSRRLPDGNYTEEEKGAWDAFEFTRSALIGKQVRFEDETFIEGLGRHSGPVTMPDGKDLGLELVRAGFATVNEKKPARMNKDQHDRYLDAMANARRTHAGMFGRNARVRTMKAHAALPGGAIERLVQQCKKGGEGTTVRCLVEKVISGSHLSVFLATDPDQQISVSLTGINCPSATQKDASGKPNAHGIAAKKHTERFLLHRIVGLRFDGVDQQNGFALVSVTSPKGTFQESLLAQGLARTMSQTLIFCGSGREAMMKSEAEAQKAKVGMWADGSSTGSTTVVAAGAGGAKKDGDDAAGDDAAAAAAAGEAPAAASKSGETDFVGTVIQVISGDTLVVRGASGDESASAVPPYHRLQLAGIRAPRDIKRADGSDPRERGAETRNSYENYTFEAKEFMRKNYIGKTVNVHMEAVVPSQEAGREPRRTASIADQDGNSLGAALLGAGLGRIAVGRNEAPPQDIDALIDGEAMARSKKMGIHGEKQAPATHVTEIHRVGEKKGKTYLGFLQRGMVGNRPPVLAGVVDTVLSGSSFRVYVPREHFTITLKLAGVSSPAGPAPGATEGGDKYWQESKDFAVLKLQNKEVDVMVESSDRTGSFIGYIMVRGEKPAAAATGASAAGKTSKAAAAGGAAAASQQQQTEHFSCQIVAAGLAAPLNADRTIISQQLTAAAKTAQENKRFVFSSPDALPARVAKRAAADHAADVVFTTSLEEHPWLPVRITDVKTNSSMFVVIENDEHKKNEATVNDLLRQLSTTGGTGVTNRTQLKRGDIVACYFKEDKSWNRAKVLTVYEKDCEVQFLDFGNFGEPSFKDVRVIPAGQEKFAPLRDTAPLAEEVGLAFLHPMRAGNECMNDAIDKIWEFSEIAEKGLVGRVEYSVGARNFVTISSAPNYLQTLQEALLSPGLSVLEAGVLKEAKLKEGPNGRHDFFFKTIESAMQAARKSHRGIFVLGDNFSDED